MKKIFDKQNTKIYYLLIIFILLVLLLYLCKKNMSENFNTLVPDLVPYTNFMNLNDNTRKNLLNKFKVDGFKINKITEKSVSYEFYEPDKTYLEGNETRVQADITDSTAPSDMSRNLSNRCFIIKEYLLIIGIYKMENDDYELKNYKIINIKPEQLKNPQESDRKVMFYNTTDQNKPRKLFFSTINLDKFDENDKLNYYKFGMITVLKYEGQEENTFSLTQTEIKNVQNLFLIQKNYKFPLKSLEMESVDKDWEDYSDMKKREREGKIVDKKTGRVISTADGEYQQIANNLGGYPENLMLQLDTNYNTLNELIAKQLSQGILDINVHTENL